MRILIYVWEGIKIAFDALRSYKLRSVLTTLGIIIGVTTVIAIVTLVQGLNKAFENQISAIGTDTLYIQKFPWNMGRDQWFVFRNRRNLEIQDAMKVKEMATLATAVAPVIETMQMVKYREKSAERVFIVGSTADLMITANIVPEYGRFMTETEVDHRRPVCVLGYDVAQTLFQNQDPIGERITVGGRKVRVIGVAEKKGSIFGQSLDSQLFMPIEFFSSVFGAKFRSIEIQVKIKTPELLDDAEIELTGLMRRIRGLKPDQDVDFAINKQSMLTDMYNNLTRTLWIVAIGVGAISLLVGGIGIMNILLVSVTERTREIGIRKAIGARKVDIMVQFLIESMMICAVGVLIGIMLAVALAKVIAATTPLPTAITLWVVFLGLGFVVSIGLFFGIYPASKAARLNPIEALRYE